MNLNDASRRRLTFQWGKMAAAPCDSPLVSAWRAFQYCSISGTAVRRAWPSPTGARRTTRRPIDSCRVARTATRAPSTSPATVRWCSFCNIHCREHLLPSRNRLSSKCRPRSRERSEQPNHDEHTWNSMKSVKQQSVNQVEQLLIHLLRAQVRHANSHLKWIVNNLQWGKEGISLFNCKLNFSYVEMLAIIEIPGSSGSGLLFLKKSLKLPLAAYSRMT